MPKGCHWVYKEKNPFVIKAVSAEALYELNSNQIIYKLIHKKMKSSQRWPEPDHCKQRNGKIISGRSWPIRNKAMIRTYTTRHQYPFSITDRARIWESKLIAVILYTCLINKYETIVLDRLMIKRIHLIYGIDTLTDNYWIECVWSISRRVYKKLISCEIRQRWESFVFCCKAEE